MGSWAEVQDLVYRRHVIVFFNPTMEDIDLFFRKKKAENPDRKWFRKRLEKGYHARCVTFSSRDSYILISEKADEFDLLHELFHATQHLAEDVGLNCMESTAYLFTFYCQQLLPWFRSKHGSQ